MSFFQSLQLAVDVSIGIAEHESQPEVDYVARRDLGPNIYQTLDSIVTENEYRLAYYDETLFSYVYDLDRETLSIGNPGFKDKWVSQKISEFFNERAAEFIQVLEHHQVDAFVGYHRKKYVGDKFDFDQNLLSVAELVQDPAKKKRLIELSKNPQKIKSRQSPKQEIAFKPFKIKPGKEEIVEKIVIHLCREFDFTDIGSGRINLFKVLNGEKIEIKLEIQNGAAAYIFTKLEPFVKNLSRPNIERSSCFITKQNRRKLTESNLSTSLNKWSNPDLKQKIDQFFKKLEE